MYSVCSIFYVFSIRKGHTRKILNYCYYGVFSNDYTSNYFIPKLNFRDDVRDLSLPRKTNSSRELFILFILNPVHRDGTSKVLVYSTLLFLTSSGDDMVSGIKNDKNFIVILNNPNMFLTSFYVYILFVLKVTTSSIFATDCLF